MPSKTKKKAAPTTTVTVPAELANKVSGNHIQTAYSPGWSWSKEHSITAGTIARIARQRFKLMGIVTANSPALAVPEQKPRNDGWRDYACGRLGNCYNGAHLIPYQTIYEHAVLQLGMKPAVDALAEVITIEKIVEKPVTVTKIKEVEVLVDKPVPLGLTWGFEKREVAAFALTRELRVTQQALAQHYVDNDDPDEALRLSARAEVIREVMADLGVEEVSGKPLVVVARSPAISGGIFDLAKPIHDGSFTSEADDAL